MDRKKTVLHCCSVPIVKNEILLKERRISWFLCACCL
uniref:Uncharacterized protein n=1 Tax=Arundo donax TaxID=35708 RepID=A0A0A9D480_ARUDO